MTADSDLCPAITIVRERCPEKKIAVLIPPGRGGIVRDLTACANKNYKIKPIHLKKSLLPRRYRKKKPVNRDFDVKS